MCMIEDADGYCTVLREHHRIARKEHKCTECHRTIGIGESYLSEAPLFDGDVSGWKTCAHCQRVRGWLTAECGGWMWGGIEEDIREHAEDSRYGVGVKLLAVGMDRQWRRRDGRMWPLPRVPQTTHQRMAKPASDSGSGSD